MSSVSSSDSGLTNYYERKTGEMEENARREHQRLERNHDEEIKELEKRYMKSLRRQEKESAESMDELRNQESDRVHKEREIARSQINDLKRKLYDKSGRLGARESEMSQYDGKALKQQLDDYVHASEEARNAQQDKEDTERASENLRQSRDLEDTVDRLDKQHAEETSELRRQLKDLTTGTRDLEKRKAEAIARDVREHENQWLLKEQQLEQANDNAIKGLKEKNEQAQQASLDRSDAILESKERAFNNLIEQQNRENAQNRQRTQNDFSNQIDALQKSRRQELERAQQSAEHRINEANTRRDQMLRQQSRNYQDILRRQRANDKEQVETLQRELARKDSGQSIADISPAAEETVRRSVIHEYEKDLDAEKARSKRQNDELFAKHTQEVKDMRLRNQTEKTNMVRDNEAQRHLEHTEFVDHVQDLESMKDTALRESDLQHERNTEHIVRGYAHEMDRQRINYESLLEQERQDANVRLNQERQDAAFRLRQAEKAFAARQSEILHDYDKKLSDQKLDYEAKIEDLKGNFEMEKREQLRASKKEMQDQTRAYDQRIAQLESQFKERERYITEQYSDQMDKMRRSDALLKKKS